MDDEEIEALPVGKWHDMRPMRRPHAPHKSCHNCNACTCHGQARVAADCLRALKDGNAKTK